MIAIDTETTGLLKPDLTDIKLQPYVTEIAAIKCDSDYNLLGTINTLIKPPVPMPDEIIKITGITNEMVKNAPTFVEIYDKLVDFFLGERIVIAHNAAFDMGVLMYELKRLGKEFHFPWPPIWHCTVELSMSIKGRRMRLKELHEIATGLPEITGAHRAMNDTKALLKSYKWLIDNGLVIND